MGEDDSKIEGCPKEVTKALETFEDVFQCPKGLPPERGREHGIVLKEGVEPVNIRPCRYPQYQKDEIEKNGERDARGWNHSK